MKTKARIILTFSFLALFCLVGFADNAGARVKKTYVEVSVSPSRSGMVKVTPKRESYKPGAQIRLVATAGSNYTFKEWNIPSSVDQNECDGSSRTRCVIVIPKKNNPGLVTPGAVFSAKPLLRVDVRQAAGGTVTGSGINCGKACESRFTAGTTVTLTARAKQGFYFAGWEDACEGVGTQPPAQAPYTCTLRIDKSKNFVTARFLPNPTLEVRIEDEKDGGTVTSPAGINCFASSTAVCSGKFALGRTITLTATPAKGYEFDGWLNCDEVSEQAPWTCKITLDSSTRVYAYFALQPLQ